MKQAHYSWNLDDIVSTAEFDQLLTSLKSDIKTYQDWLGKLTADIDEAEFAKYLDFSDQVSERLSKAFNRAGLAEALNETDEVAKLQKAKVKDIALRCSDASRPITNWLKGIDSDAKPGLDDKNAKRLFAVKSELTYNLEYMRAAAKYTLNESEESILVNKDANGIGPLVDLRDYIASEQTFELKVEGKKPKQIQTEEELKALIVSIDPKLRQAAYLALFDVYNKNAQKYFMAYQAVVKDWGYEAKLRGYKNPISMRNFANHVPDRAINVLMNVCEQNISIFQEFFKFKAKQLGVKKLSRFDLYAPLKSHEKSYSLQESIDVVLTTLANFSPNFKNYAAQIINKKHLDTEPRKHKTSGAFCATISPNLEPYILLNFTARERDVATLAHELGHGIHSMYASHLPISVQHATLPLAETASTLAEMILFEKLLTKTSTKEEKISMLAEKMSDSYATIIRQNYFVKAEIEAHNKMPQGLTPTDMGKIWLKTLHNQFGDCVEVDPIFAYEWAYIPHIVHTPFYCYAYNFGELLSLALYARYKAEGKSFVPKIEKILASGGSRDPQEVLQEVGIDMTSADFWQGSFEIIKSWQVELNNLAK